MNLVRRSAGVVCSLLLITDACALRMGFFDNILSKMVSTKTSVANTSPKPTLVQTNPSRQTQFPEQYIAVKNKLALPLSSDTGDMRLIRPLLCATQLESRRLQLAYQASRDGWSSKAFHNKCNGKGAAMVLVKSNKRMFGGYNPKGWAGLGENRPSVAAFLFALSPPLKLCKVGGGGLAVANDNSGSGIYFGPDSLVVPLDGARTARSRLGGYYEALPDGSRSLFGATSEVTLDDVIVYTGVYAPDEDIPYSGGVFDMTSG